MSEPIKGYGDGKDNTIYEYSNGRQERWVGGWPAWRNNNPGNVKKNEDFVWDGEIGINGSFCVFSDPKWGERATKILIKRYSERNQTLAEGIHSYAPKKENDTEAYIKHVVQFTGIPRDTMLKDVLDRVDDIAEAIFKHEGYREGTIEVLQEGKKTGKYIWHTAEDKKVRVSHKVRDGKVFDWANPPPDGHPGEAFRCRCWAEDLPEKE